MANSEDNKVQGKVDEVKGKVKDKFGGLVDDKEQQVSGKVDKAKGKAKQKFSEAQEKWEDNK